MRVFTPKQYKKEPITVRIDFKKLDLIDKLSAKYNISRSEFINQCIDYALANISDSHSSWCEESF